MQVMKWSVIALAVAAGTSQMAFASAQSESNGFTEDSSLNVLNRNFYMNRDYRDSANGAGQSYREEWAHGLIGTFESGFTQGTVGFGADAIGLLGIKLDSSADRANTGLLPVGSNGKAPDDYSKAGAAVKARVSNTVLKYGDQFVALPVLSTDDSRLLPETTEGFLVTSSEIEGLELNAGHFTTLRNQAETNADSAGLKSLDLVGGSYAFSDSLSGALYYSDVAEAFDKYYGNLNYVQAISDSQSLTLDFNAYQTEYKKGFTGTGSEADNTIWSLSAAYALDAHTFTVAYQDSNGGFGSTGYAYGLDGGATIWLANSVQYSDFYYKDEKSWQGRYDLDMTAFGVPGLSFMTRYIYGDNIDVGTGDASEKEWNIEAKYVVQDGAAKDLSFRVRQAFYRADSELDNDINDLRVIVEYPLSVL